MSVAQGCVWLGISRSRFYRYRNPSPGAGVKIPQADRDYPHRISSSEAAAIVDRLNQPDVADLSVREAFHRLLDAGDYRCSLSSMHRIMAAAGQSGDRRGQRPPGSCPKVSTPQVTASGPGQVWCWDITNLPGCGRIVYKLYTVIDLFSRAVVAHRVETREGIEFAAAMFTNAFASVSQAPRLVHADNGQVMRAGRLRELFASLQVGVSYSRPRVSNDNAFAEAVFKTVKYHQSYPEHFDSIETARVWCAEFFEAYNHHHHHSGLAGHTPARVHDGSWTQVHQQWQATKAAYAARYPQRHRKPPVTHTPAAVVWINPPNKPTQQLSQTA